MRATTACDPRISCAAAAAAKIDRKRIDFRSGVARLSHRSMPVSVGLRRAPAPCARGASAVARTRRPPRRRVAPPCSRANCLVSLKSPSCLLSYTYILYIYVPIYHNLLQYELILAVFSWSRFC